MIPFPGESLSVYSFENRVGTPIEALADIAFRAGGAYFGPGAMAKVVVFLGSEYLETDTDPGEVSWCIEVAGGTGSLTLTECLGNGEPDVPLGTFDVAPGDTLVVPSLTLTLANVFNDTFASLMVECTGPALMIQQVKLRAFPTGGPLGGWGDELHDPWTQTAYPSWLGAGRLSNEAGWERPTALPLDDPSRESAWPLTVACMPDIYEGGVDDELQWINVTSDAGPLGRYIATMDLSASSSSYDAPGYTPHSEGGWHGTINGAIVSRRTHAPDLNPAEGLVEGVDYIANPYEVWGDDGAFATADTAPVNTWDQEYVVGGATRTMGELVEWGVSEGNYPPEVTWPYIGVLPWTGGEPAPEGNYNLWPDQASRITEDLVPDITMPDVDQVLIGTAHQWYFYAFHPAAPTDPLSGGDPLTYSTQPVSSSWWWQFTQPITYSVAMPAYRVWNVNAPRRRKLRQLHRDDGLGGTPPRAFGGASRNRTQRAYGYT